MSADGSGGKTSGAACFDEAALLRLLSLAGPKDARELLRRLLADLRNLAEGLDAAAAQGDPAALRRHSHVLIAVAGTVGAEALTNSARAINQAAKEDPTTAFRDIPETVAGVFGLVAALSGLASDLGGGA